LNRLVTPLLLAALWCVPATAQQRPPVPDTAQADSANRLTPGKAFYRSLLVPGWGQASVGEYLRGGIFFGLQTSSAYMMLKTMARLGEAKQIEKHRVAAAGDSLRALMQEDTALNRLLSDPQVFTEAVDSTIGVRRARGLIQSRTNQRQDWVTYTIVWTLASGVDAFVAAHLSDFGATVEAVPRGSNGAALRISVPIGKVRR
jgi:hypothetical protein